MKREGFTLLEVLISVAIFFLIAGAIFTAVSVSVKATTTLAQHRLQGERMDTLLNFLHSVFTNLPPQAEMLVRSRDVEVRFSSVELLLRKAPGAYALIDGGSGQAGSVLSILPSNGGGTLAIKSYRDSLTESEREQYIKDREGWTRLMDGVQQMKWRFLDPKAKELVETWDFNQGRPLMVEMTLWIAGEKPTTMEFWIPEVKDPKAVKAPAKS